MKKAFAGAYGVFCLTNFLEHFSPEKELAQAKSQAQAAKDAGVQHVVWSTLEDTRRWEFTKLGAPRTFLLTSFYWDNLIHLGMGPKKGPDGTLAFTLPMGDKKLPGIAAEDIGACALGIFKEGREYIGKTVGIAGEHLTGTQMAAASAKALGQSVRYNAVTPEIYRSFGFPGADDLGNMFQFKRDFESIFCGVRNLDQSRALNPALQTFDQWLAQNTSRIPLK